MLEDEFLQQMVSICVEIVLDGLQCMECQYYIWFFLQLYLDC